MVKLVLSHSPNVHGGGKAGFPVIIAYFWMISLGVEPWIRYMDRASPGMAILILVVRSVWISKEIKDGLGMNTPYPAEVKKNGMFL